MWQQQRKSQFQATYAQLKALADDPPEVAFERDARAYNALVDQLTSLGFEVQAFKIYDQDMFLPVASVNSITHETTYHKHTQVHYRVLDRKVKALIAYLESSNTATSPDPNSPSESQQTVSLAQEQWQADQPIERRAPMNNKVWVIHGHDHRARNVIFALLTAVGLQPLEFEQAAELTGKPSPFIMEILQAAFREGQAFIALFTPDEEAVPSPAFKETDVPGPHPQPRPNVVFEAGMAFAYDPARTIILEMGRIRVISDLAGIHSIKWQDDSPETRRRLLRKLKLAKCPVDDTGDHWMRAGGKYP